MSIDDESGLLDLSLYFELFVGSLWGDDIGSLLLCLKSLIELEQEIPVYDNAAIVEYKSNSVNSSGRRSNATRKAETRFD